MKEGGKWEQLYLSEHPEILGKDPRSYSAQSIVIRQIGSVAKMRGGLNNPLLASNYNPISGTNTVIDGNKHSMAGSFGGSPKFNARKRPEEEINIVIEVPIEQENMEDSNNRSNPNIT